MTTNLDYDSAHAGPPPASTTQLRVAVVGVGKMGLSHLSILRAHPEVSIEAVCDSNGYVLDVLGANTGLVPETDYAGMLDRTGLDAVVIATPTRSHFAMVKAALEHGLHVFCEKPLTLSAAESAELSELVTKRNLVGQVGYHNRFVAAFAEAARLLELGAIGTIHHARAEAYGPVVLKPKGSTWRSRRSEGGGCLYDYAAHPLDLLTWYLGIPTRVSGTVLGRVFSAETEDEVYSTLHYDGGVSAQLSVNWSDESYRKMSTKVTLWGTDGRITVDRQECQVYLRDSATPPEGYRPGWNVKYTTELTPPVWFYVRGEEYSAELDHFVRRVIAVKAGEPDVARNDFASASVADRVIELLLADAAGQQSADGDAASSPTAAAGTGGRGRVSAMVRVGAVAER
ncbi:MAG: Gfo/Idh/MocA family oxidoreductase, partial [Nocardioides sp.]|uniref:Gfo/Idh/MocA family protein n=1 Tax=Nocardioides sp. TaxID=35761 RepID=UPI0039E2FD5B